MRLNLKIDVDPVRLIIDNHIKRPLMVSSHERSGTHFLINTVANNSPYSNNPILNYDLDPLGSFLNFTNVSAVEVFFEYLRDHGCASVVKSHFAAPFFISRTGDFILRDTCTVIYIVRNPVDVVLSYRRFINHFPWHEGPRKKSALDFLAAAPEGQMLRYQFAQCATILDRWHNHIRGWWELAQRESNILILKYEDLNVRHAETTQTVLDFLGVACPETVVRPDRLDRNVSVPNFDDVSLEDTASLRRAIVERLGYDEVIGGLFPDLYD